jgi:hypothetical protein
MGKLRSTMGSERFGAGRYEFARDLIEGIVQQDAFADFMTTVGYEHLD